MVCEVVKIDSNITGLSIAEEVCLKQLPVLAVDGFDPTWYGQEPNSYSDFGGDLTTVARAPIDPSRQNKKGTVTDLDASGGYNTDFTKSNMTRILQGFFFADAREPASTVPMNGPRIAITGVTAADKTYTIASGGTNFAAGQLILAAGFANAANNGLKRVTASTATTVVVAETVVDEAAPPAGAKFQRVGGELIAGDVSFAVVDGIPSLVSTTTDFSTFPNLFAGKWLFIGGDATANRFVNNVGFARIKAVSANSITFDDTTWAPVNEAGTGKSIRFFAGISIKNEKLAALIKRRSYQIERTLGEGPEAENPGDQQAEYLIGAVCNELTVNIPQADKINADLTFVACDNTYRSGAAGDENKIKSSTLGTLVSAPGEDAFNTSSDIYRIKMAIVDPSTSAPSPLFGFVSEANVSINNGVTPNKAVGVLGAFDTSAANFTVGGSITAYFTSVAAVKAVRANADVGLSIIAASKNAGFIFDIPLLGLGGGRINVEKDAPITVPLEPAGAENPNGYTMLFESFVFLPNVAMPG